MIGLEKPSTLKRTGLRLMLLASSVAVLSACGGQSSDDAVTFKNLENRYASKSLFEISTTDYKAIDTTNIPEIRRDELYYGRGMSKHWTGYEPSEEIYVQDNLDKLTKVLEREGLVKTAIVRDASAVTGDTFNASLENGESVSIRLIGIDAPKEGMGYYNESIQSLNECIKHTPELTVIIPKTKSKFSREGQVLAHAFSENISCNQYQIANGGAMFYKPKFYDLFDFQLGNFYYLDEMAKENFKGIWGQRFKTQPWLSKYKPKEDY